MSANTHHTDDERVETPTRATLAPSPSVSRISTKLADVNRSVTHPIRLLHETLMLELFQEQLRVPSPARQSTASSSSRTSIAAAAARHSIGRTTSTPTSASSYYRRSAAGRHSLDDSSSAGRASISLMHTPRPTIILYEGETTSSVVSIGRPSSSSPLARAAAEMERAPLRASSTAPATRASLTAVPPSALDGFDMAQSRDCQICFDKMDALQAQVCVTCNGSFCSTCMQWYVEFKILDGEVSSKKLVCPAPQCTRSLPTELIEAFASQETFAKYESFLKNQKTGVRFCPRAGCCAVLDEPPHSTHRKVKCSACDAESCMRCGGAYHRTRLCRRVDKRYGHWKRHHNVRACPRCKSDIEKQGGCSHMKCFQCDQEFCWSCLRSWDKHDETLCLPLAFYHSRSRKFGWTSPVRFVTKTVVLGAASVVVVAGAGVAVVVVPPLLGYYFVRDRFSRKDPWRTPLSDTTAAPPQH